MANTMKFGNGQWATKEDSILAYNDENANFKPLPFVASRASTATRVNKAGLLETVASGVPRVDYSGNSKGSYLLEPQSTNLITYSESFGNSYWTKSGASIEGDASTAGVEKVVNGDFSTDSDWTKSSAISIELGVASFDGSQVTSNLTQGISFSIGKTYVIQYEITSYTSGLIKAIVSGESTQENSSVGVYLYQVTATSSNFLTFRGLSTFIGSIDNVSIKEVQGFSAPSVDSPLGAFKLVESSANSTHFMYSNTATVSNGVSSTVSVILKYSGVQWIAFNTQFGSTNARGWFDVQNGVLGTQDSGLTANIEHLGNGWYRCSNTYLNDGTSARLRFYLVSADNNNGAYQGDGTSGVYIFASQLEQKSYATSYIPTAGGAITRLAETASQTVPDGIINSSQGVLYAEISALSQNPQTNRFIILNKNNDSNLNRLTFRYLTSSNKLSMEVHIGGVLKLTIQKTLPNTTLIQKIALKYKQNDYAFWVNGVEAGVSALAEIWSPNTLNNIDFTGFGQDFHGKVKDLRVYNTALTDAELQTLTTI